MQLKDMIEAHVKATGSEKGKEILVSNLEIPPMEQEQIKVG